jgi:molybdopterin biosynthesis enzyme MoaB
MGNGQGRITRKMIQRPQRKKFHQCVECSLIKENSTPARKGDIGDAFQQVSHLILTSGGCGSSISPVLEGKFLLDF